jgi:hypothetical protein
LIKFHHHYRKAYSSNDHFRRDMGKRGDGRGMAAILNKAKSVKAEAEEAGEGSNEEFERGCLLGMDC